MDKIRTAVSSALESIELLDDISNHIIRSMVLGYFLGVKEQLQEVLNLLDGGEVYVVCCNDGMLSVTFNKEAAEAEVSRLKLEYDKQWANHSELNKPFVYYHVHDVSILTILKGVHKIGNEAKG